MDDIFSVADTELQKTAAAAGLTMDTDALRAVLGELASAPYSPTPTASLRQLAPEADPDSLAALHRIVTETAERFEASLVNVGDTPARLKRVRAEMAAQNLDGLLVPMADAFQNEYVPNFARRIAWLTGFTGSAGLAVILQDKAAVFTDGRYTLQIRDQVDTNLFETHHITDAPATLWLQKHMQSGQKLGYDPWLFTKDSVARFRKATEAGGIDLVAASPNPVDAAWRDQPPEPLAAVITHPDIYSGESSHSKRQKIAEAIAKDGLDAVAITATDSASWLLNIRGGDVAHTPLALSYCLLHRDGTVDWFIEPRKLSAEVMTHLGNTVRVRPLQAFQDALGELGKQSATVGVDTAMAPAHVSTLLTETGAAVKAYSDPCQLPKACKNDVEVSGTRKAHDRDGVALTRFLHWLAVNAPGGTVDELTAEAKLADFRAADPMLRDLSFSSIAGSGPNGAIVHYRVTAESNRTLNRGELFLLDSGGQYPDGTTDVTRTIAIGAPTNEMRDRFTRVLKGHIALACCKFPEGTTGSQLDSLARAPLWQAGLDFDHGTGHGVGSYLGVHEGPQRISKAPNSVALQPGMIISNEPGYYKTGAYGIRIENLVVVKADPDFADNDRRIYCFDTLTKAPIDQSLIDTNLLSPDERAWLNSYHQSVFQTLSPHLDSECKAWLESATAEI